MGDEGKTVELGEEGEEEEQKVKKGEEKGEEWVEKGEYRLGCI